MKQYLRHVWLAVSGIALIVVILLAVGREPAHANANIRRPMQPLVLITDSLRDISLDLDRKIADLNKRDIALRTRMSMPVVTDALLTQSAPSVGENGVELPRLGNDVPELSDRISRQQRFIDVLDHAIERRQAMLDAMPMLTPCDGRYSSSFGMRVHPISGEEKMHTGTDIAAPWGRAIRAAGDGVVWFSGTRHGYGNVVELDHGYGYHTLYGHASRLLVKNGDTVHRGQTIALVGATGAATGPHLHYEVIIDDTKVNPTPFLIQPAVAEPVAAAPPAPAVKAVKHTTAKAAAPKRAPAKAAVAKHCTVKKKCCAKPKAHR